MKDFVVIKELFKDGNLGGDGRGGWSTPEELKQFQVVEIGTEISW